MKRPAEIVDLVDERAIRGPPVVQIREVAWERADGQLVFQGETMIFTGDGLNARRYDDQIANRFQVLATRWTQRANPEAPPAPIRRRRHRVKRA